MSSEDGRGVKTEYDAVVRVGAPPYPLFSKVDERKVRRATIEEVIDAISLEVHRGRKTTVSCGIGITE